MSNLRPQPKRMKIIEKETKTSKLNPKPKSELLSKDNSVNQDMKQTKNHRGEKPEIYSKISLNKIITKPWSSLLRKRNHSAWISKTYFNNTNKDKEIGSITKGINIITLNNQDNYKITFKLLSNWGDRNIVEIYNITLWDKDNKEIPIIKTSIHLPILKRISLDKTNQNSFDVYISNTYVIHKIEIINGEGIKGVNTWSVIKNNKLLWSGPIPKGEPKARASYTINILKEDHPRINIINPNSTINTSGYISNNHNNKNSGSAKKIIVQRNDHYSTTTVQKKPKPKQPSRSVIVNLSPSNRIKSSSASRIHILNHNKKNNKLNDTTKQISLDWTNNEYITCNKIRVFLVDNYSTNSKFIGWSNITFIDPIDKPISFNHLIKNVQTRYSMNKGLQNKSENILNLFNDRFQTTNTTEMWFINKGKIKPNYIEITLWKDVNIKGFIIYNYNNLYFSDIATKVFYVGFYQDTVNKYTTNKLFLNKSPGEMGWNMKQVFSYPFYPNIKYGKEEMETITNLYFSNAKTALNNEYYSPIYPVCSTLKFIWVNNHGDCDYIGWDNWEIYSYSGENLMNTAKIISWPEKETKAYNKESQGMYWNKYYNILKVSNRNYLCNVLVVWFDSPVVIGRIVFNNYRKLPKIGVKSVKVLGDDCILYEGDIEEGKEINLSFAPTVIEDCNYTNWKEIWEEESIYTSEIGENYQEMSEWGYNALVLVKDK